MSYEPECDREGNLIAKKGNKVPDHQAARPKPVPSKASTGRKGKKAVSSRSKDEDLDSSDCEIVGVSSPKSRGASVVQSVDGTEDDVDRIDVLAAATNQRDEPTTHGESDETPFKDANDTHSKELDPHRDPAEVIETHSSDQDVLGETSRANTPVVSKTKKTHDMPSTPQSSKTPHRFFGKRMYIPLLSKHADKPTALSSVIKSGRFRSPGLRKTIHIPSLHLTRHEPPALRETRPLLGGKKRKLNAEDEEEARQRAEARRQMIACETPEECRQRLVRELAEDYTGEQEEGHMNEWDVEVGDE